nr:winged helix-turn-helix transcriptional regulator [Halovivax sp. TS33]
MRPRVEWMNQTDDRILELLEESGLVLSPAVTAVNLDYSRNWVSRRMSKLEKAGLLERVNGSYYKISDKGQAYLEGVIETSELEDSNL